MNTFELMTGAWILNLVSTVYMTGLIWFVQIVHYPLHGIVSRQTFSLYQEKHMAWTKFVVGPPMFFEALTAAWLAYQPPHFGSPIIWQFAFALVVLNLVSTAVIQVPVHQQMLGEYSERDHRRLLWSNWLRTVAWSLRTSIWIYALWQLAKLSR